MHGTTSFTRFISVRLLSAALVICVLWFFVARDLYWSALDGTSAFYLFEDAEQAFQVHKKGLDVASLNTPFKQFYLTEEDLPQEIQTNAHRQNYLINEVSLVVTDTQDIYVLAYQAGDSEPVIYVVHRFDVEDTQDISPILYLISFAVLFLMFALMWFVVVRLQRQSQKLTRALVEVEQLESSADIHFDIAEFQAIYQEVQSAYQQRLQALQREKQYSAFLSHEIRHSLASINAWIEKLDQIDGFPLDALSPMDEARQESVELQRIANAILALWQTDRLTTSRLDIVGELKALVAQYGSGELTVEWQLSAPEKTIQCDRDLFHLLARQLLQNAKQYGKSLITIMVTNEQLQISNDVESATTPDSGEYGYKVGMLLVEKICETMQWCLHQTSENHRFSVTITFDKNANNLN